MLRSALSYKKRADDRATAAQRTARSLWRRVDRSGILQSWRTLSGTLLTTLMAAQADAGAQSTTYVADAIRSQGGGLPPHGEVNPWSLVGTASDGRPLDTLLLSPALTAIEALNRGATLKQALGLGRVHLDMITATQVTDAYRAAASVASTSRKVTRYVRAITPPSCSRCVILAGESMYWKTDFRRHPRCRCTSVPLVDGYGPDLITYPRDYFNSLTAAEQDRIFTKAGARAIRDGADMARVVNARRKAAGLSGATEGQRRRLRTQTVFGEELFTTAELRVRGSRGQRIVRLMPESIYARARDHDDAIRLLRVHGYLY